MRQRFHFIGVGGIGMSALAHILVQRGYSVSGSDIKNSGVVEKLRTEGVEIHIGHDGAHVPQDSCVIYSSGIAKNNSEYEQAKSLNSPMMHRSEMLAFLMEGYKPLLVTGTHGKTTTSALLAHVLIQAGEDPSCAIGGVVPSIGGNNRHGSGEYFVAEADESDGSFLAYSPFGAIVTNIDTDHMDYWGSFERLKDGFSCFMDKVSGPLIWCGDDPILKALHPKGLSYGKTEGVSSRIVHGGLGSFDLTLQGKIYKSIQIPLIGEHNILNAAAVFTLSTILGIQEDVIKRAFQSFQGVKRRFEKKGEIAGTLVYDDYGHHPTEIAETLKAVREGFLGKRICIIFQPHRYTRTQECWELFKEAFSVADSCIITDIYSAGESPIQGITGLLLAESCKAIYLARKQLAEQLIPLISSYDIVLTMGAGDITTTFEELSAWIS